MNLKNQAPEDASPGTSKAASGSDQGAVDVDGVWRIAPVEWRRDGYLLSTDRALLDMDFIHHFLSNESWWARGMPRPVLERAIAHSLPFGLYAPGGEQVGFARVVTDYAALAYLRDVFVIPQHGGRGLASWAATVMRDHPELATVRNWLLSTDDAHGVYRRAGFEDASNPASYMQVKRAGWSNPG